MGELHNSFIRMFAEQGYVVNLNPETKYSVDDGNRKFIPDLLTEDTVVEVECTGDKTHYYSIKRFKTKLILLVNSLDAFDCVELYSIDNGQLPKFVAKVK